jgi:hypothetical protein
MRRALFFLQRISANRGAYSYPGLATLMKTGSGKAGIGIAAGAGTPEKST